LRLYRKYIKQNSKKRFNNEFYHNLYTNQVPWKERISKANFIGNMGRIRQVLFDIAVLRPDLLYANWTYPSVYLRPWNPLSNETTMHSTALHSISINNPQQLVVTTGRQHMGFISNILPLKIPKEVNPNFGSFKYIVVLLGLNDGYATSDRLAGLLAHSGAVILLQESAYSYHFSPFLKPWIHYGMYWYCI
jgi:hypothetical protein